MKIDFTNSDLGENPTLKEEVSKDTEVKTWLVNYVGSKANPEDGNVTIEMILEVMANEFPEFVMPIAEENFIRGYHQAIMDVEYGEGVAATSSKTATKKAAPKKRTRKKAKKTTKTKA